MGGVAFQFDSRAHREAFVTAAVPGPGPELELEPESGPGPEPG